MDVRSLPIEALRKSFLDVVETGPVVLSSPTGSGKSTQVPRWCLAKGKVLVVEPRRVACRGLAKRVAELEGRDLGTLVGYHVRDDRRAQSSTQMLFATPGVALRLFDTVIDRYDTILVDEFHERGLEVDLLLALLLKRRREGRFRGRLVVMSATLDGNRLAEQVEGAHLHAEGRTFPVDIVYLPQKALLPEVRGLEERLVAAVRASAKFPGDLLVFLPGKGEIAAAARALEKFREFEILFLHGGLSLAEQSRIFDRGKKRRVILSTNVAETSLTVPGVGVVVDSGLVRQTRYVRDRGFLTLVPVATDSADQRAGRAGRTAAGVCFRLWSEAARLEERTPPAMHRESLVPLVLAAASQGEKVQDLPFADPPKTHALETAEEELRILGALDGPRITERGRRLFGLPLDAELGRRLVEAEARDPELLADMIDLVSVLAVDRSVIAPPSPDELEEDPSQACDAVACIRAVRGALPERARRHALDEARSVRRRLRKALEVRGDPPTSPNIDRERLIDALLAADPRVAHVARQRGKRTAWSNGGTEIALGRDCGPGTLENVEAVLVLSTMALGLGGRDSRTVATLAMPVTLRRLAQAGLGRDRLARLDVENGAVVARIERVYAKKILSERTEIPEGELAREAVVRLFLDGRLFRKIHEQSREHLETAVLARRLAERLDDVPYPLQETLAGEPPPSSFEEWVAERVRELGVERGDDLALLSPEDLLYPAPSALLREEMDRAYPRRLKIQGVTYRVDYDLAREQITLELEQGKPQKPPDPFFLPRFPGFKVRVEHKGTFRKLR